MSESHGFMATLSASNVYWCSGKGMQLHANVWFREGICSLPLVYNIRFALFVSPLQVPNSLKQPPEFSHLAHQKSVPVKDVQVSKTVGMNCETWYQIAVHGSERNWTNSCTQCMNSLLFCCIKAGFWNWIFCVGKLILQYLTQKFQSLQQFSVVPASLHVTGLSGNSLYTHSSDVWKWRPT